MKSNGIIEIALAGVATAITSTIQDWLGIVLTAINIIVMVIQLIRKIAPKVIELFNKTKKATEDGIIDEEEKKEIVECLDDIKSDIESEVNNNGR